MGVKETSSLLKDAPLPDHGTHARQTSPDPMMYILMMISGC